MDGYEMLTKLIGNLGSKATDAVTFDLIEAAIRAEIVSQGEGETLAEQNGLTLLRC